MRRGLAKPPRGRTYAVPYALVSTEGWRCVRCVAGLYLCGRCSSCGFEVSRYARLPRRLVKPGIRGAA
jgi:hypothetical protein